MYLKQIGPRLERFKQKETHKWHCRCPICGDSKKKINKTRGTFYVRGGSLLFGCYNCGASQSFDFFLKNFDHNLFKQYSLDIFKEKMAKQAKLVADTMPHIPETQKYIPNIFADLPLVSTLDENSQPFLFCVKRHLPLDFEFYFAEKFIEWSKDNTTKFENWKGEDHSRIVIPWRDRRGKIIGYSARALNNLQEQKYFRIFIDESAKERFFGMDRLDESKQIYVLEGEIDSLMIPNAVAVANGKLQSYFNKNAIYIPDADVRNKHIMKNVNQMIEAGLKVCMMPSDLPGKDLNELVQAGWSASDIIEMVEANTYQGLEAKLHFIKWKNV